MNFLTGRYVWTAILLGLLAATIGCARTPNDAQVTEQIHSKLNQDSGLQGKSINIADIEWCSYPIRNGRQ